MKRFLLLLLPALNIWGSGILSWNLSGGTVRCRNVDDPTLDCVGASPFSMGEIWVLGDTSTSGPYTAISNPDTPETIWFAPTSIVGLVGDSPMNTVSFSFIFAAPLPANYGFQNVPVIASITMSNGAWLSEGENMVGTLSNDPLPDSPDLQLTPRAAPEPRTSIFMLPLLAFIAKLSYRRRRPAR